MHQHRFFQAIISWMVSFRLFIARFFRRSPWERADRSTGINIRHAYMSVDRRNRRTEWEIHWTSTTNATIRIIFDASFHSGCRDWTQCQRRPSSSLSSISLASKMLTHRISTLSPVVCECQSVCMCVFIWLAAVGDCPLPSAAPMPLVASSQLLAITGTLIYN